MVGKPLEIGPTGRTVAFNINRLRRRSDLNFTEVSARLKQYGREIPALGVRRIEEGERRVDVDDLMAFALVLGVNPNALLLPAAAGTQVLTLAEEKMYPAATVWKWAKGEAPLDHSDVPDTIEKSMRATYARDLFDSKVDPQQNRDPASPNVSSVISGSPNGDY